MGTFPDPVTILLNGLVLSLALGLLIILLWYDAKKTLNQTFALFLLLVIVWNAGYLLMQAALLASADVAILRVTYGVAQAGFAGSAIMLYVMMNLLAGVQSRRFRLLSLISLVMVSIYQIFLIVISNEQTFDYTSTPIIFLLINSITIYITWNNRQKIQNNRIITGVLLYILGQTLTFLNPDLGISAAAINISAISSLILSFTFIQQEIISPLKNQAIQIESMHDVTLAITSQIPTDYVLKEITERARSRMEADAACIFLAQNQSLELVASHNLPAQVQGTKLKAGEGLAGKVTGTKRPVFIENYARQWEGQEDIPEAKKYFGAVICVPLIYDNNVLGTLMTINGQNSKIPRPEDVRLLELLASQAAVAISHGQLFRQQQSLADQLRKLLISTENPVIATDRQLHLIFMNPSAEKLIPTIHDSRYRRITDIVPAAFMPASYKAVLKSLRYRRTHNYEINANGEVFDCHITSLGGNRVEGWVAVLNNITQLKELDRIKSEVVRMTSHDLKNPLQAALAHIDLLQEELLDLPTHQELQDSVSKIEKQLEKMNRIIGGILDLERIRSSARHNELCEPASLIQSAVSELRDIAEDKHIHLDVELGKDLHPFQGDASQFERAIVNLIENAIKFTAQGGSVRVESYNRGGDVMIIVSDTGIGIPDDIQGQIFERFFRGQQPGAEHISGSGLGLNLVKTVIENHQGQINVESRPGQGTRFTIRIPAGNQQQHYPSTLN